MLVQQKHKQQPSRAATEISTDFIASLLERTDIVRVVGRSVPLKKSGNNHFGLCPFHGEKSPSFSVAEDKQIYHCFGCGLNGDAISFLREYAGLSFKEAVTELAEEAGMPMPTAGIAAAPAADLTKLFATNELAAAFFKHCLRYTPNAKNYLADRQLEAEALNRFTIGYAPDGWQALQEAFPSNYASSTELVELGLVVDKTSENAGSASAPERRYDRFRDRIMFGIRDARGRIAGWGGRSLDGSLPKYLNSPQSALFNKSNQLFGLFEAREGIRRTKQVIVTEGFFDTISNSMAGVTQTVATMGTACTEHHLERLVSLAPEVIFCFDGDKAGLAAAWKSLNTCLPFADDDRMFRFMLLPPGMDPDEVIRQKGAEAYKSMLAQAMTLSSFLISELTKANDDLKSPENRAKFLHDGLALLEHMPPAGRLKGIMRSDLMKVSDLQAPTPAPAPAQAPKTASLPERSKSSQAAPWLSLTQAVKAQPLSAASRADELIGLLGKDLQDAFFASKFESFSEFQQPFWRALDEAILEDEPADTETSLCLAQRDLIARAPEFVKALMAKDAAAAARAAFRNGQTSEGDFLSSVRDLRRAQPEG